MLCRGQLRSHPCVPGPMEAARSWTPLLPSTTRGGHRAPAGDALASGRPHSAPEQVPQLLHGHQVGPRPLGPPRPAVHHLLQPLLAQLALVHLLLDGACRGEGRVGQGGMPWWEG